MGDEVQTWLGYAAAARRVKSSKNTIRRWAREGMPMEWRLSGAGQRERVVDEEILLAWWRRKMSESPVHQNRIRRRFLDAGETPPEWNDAMLAQRARAAATRDQSASGSQDTEEASEAVTEAVATWEDVLRELPPFHGQAEHAALIRAMEETPAACDGIETFTRDKFLDPEETDIMRAICHACPLLDLCAAYAHTGRPAAGMWAGMVPSEIRELSSR